MSKTVVALGFFDGVHRAHAELLSHACRMAERMGAEPVAITFDRHPAALFSEGPGLLTSVEERIRLIRSLGVGRTEVLTFDRRMADTEPERFLEDTLARTLRAAGVVAGENFTFGREGRGDASLLARECARLGLDFDLVPTLTDGGEPISSTRIRRVLTAGDLPEAERLLGHPFSVSGEVIHGRELGRTIGFPTANLIPAEGLCLPPEGVYAARVFLPDGTRHAAVADLGHRPTLGDASGFRLEAHLLDHDEDLYGRSIRVELLDRLRPEVRCKDLRELADLIARDAAAVRAMHIS